MKKTRFVLLSGLLLAGANAMACYTVYDHNERVIYQNAEPPVDLSVPLHETLGRSHPGAHMVFDQTADCRAVAFAPSSSSAREVPPNTIRIVRDGPAPARIAEGPLLTSRGNAARQALPHTVVAGDIVAVPSSAAARDRTPAMTVVPAAAVVATAAPSRGFDTRVMGGPPARTSAAPAPARHITVITEYRDGRSLVQRY